ncbi:MAG: hypothetical protein ACE5K8_03925, partial [Candidatus Zixiibacteriota bacterium]
MIRILFLIAFVPSVLWSQDDSEYNEWEHLGFLIGSWQGEVTGTAGRGKGVREFRLILNGKFIHIKNKVVFEPNEGDSTPEVREDWGIMSADEARETLVLRQFSTEGYVNQYVVDSVSDSNLTIFFVAESTENAPEGTKARLTITIHNPDEFTEILERTFAGKDLTERLESHWVRK